MAVRAIRQKKIIVEHRGPIHSKGWMYGPITKPYMEFTNIIFQMISQPVNKVIEIFEDGGRLELDITNFDRDNKSPNESNEPPISLIPIGPSEPIINLTPVGPSEPVIDLTPVGPSEPVIPEQEVLVVNRTKKQRR